jgi:hypothetical protein
MSYALVPVPQFPITYTLVNLNIVLGNDPFDVQATNSLSLAPLYI